MGRPDRLWGPPNLLSNGYWRGSVYLGVKQPGREANHSPAFTLEAKNGDLYLHCPYVFMAWYLITGATFTFQT
jgi:hypothetical protein